MKRKQNFSSAIVGFLFALGLGVSGMTQPKKVVGFLDVTGEWDPTLIFVMLGAIAIHFITYRMILKRDAPLFSSEWRVPSSRKITPSLMIGSFIFGTGWALAGYCPGPALTSLASFEFRPLIFVVAMVAGMFLFRWVNRLLPLER